MVLDLRSSSIRVRRGASGAYVAAWRLVRERQMASRSPETSPQILAPEFAANYLLPWIVLPAFPAELGLALWLTVKGVNVPKWKERARG